MRASTARSQNNGSTAKCVVQLCRRLDARRPTNPTTTMARLGPAELRGSRPRRSGGCAISLPWIRRVSSFSGLFQKIGHDMDRASSRSVFSCCPGPPAGRCHAAVWPRTFGYLVVLLTEVTPYWMAFCPARGLNVGHGQSSTKRGGLDPAVEATANRHRKHARLRGLAGRGTVRTFLWSLFRCGFSVLFLNAQARQVCILEFRGKVNSRTQCVCNWPLLPPSFSSAHTTDTACTHACQDSGGGKVLMACIQTDSLSGHGSILSPTVPRRRVETSDDVSVPLVPINQGVVYTLLWRDGSPSVLGYLPTPRLPLGVSLAGGGGGVLTHLSMAAHLLRGRREDSRIGNATRASSFLPASVSIYLPGAARMRVYAVNVCVFGPDLNTSMRRRRRGGGADDFLGHVSGRPGRQWKKKSLRRA